MNIKQQIAQVISSALKHELSVEEVESLLEKPKYEKLGDLAFPCFSLAKKFRQSPQMIAEKLSEQIEANIIDKTVVENGYLNIFLLQLKVAQYVTSAVMTQKLSYGSKNKNQQNVLLDFSSPNIAKPFSMGHLRSTVIGNALANIAEKNGYTAIRINHLGDWGTQFGKLIVAYRLWGQKEKIEQNPIEELLKIYVQFHEEAERNDGLNDEARLAFKTLEDGNEEALALWQWFRDASLEEFQNIYALLGIKFDSYHGEAFYNDKMAIVVEELERQQLLIESDGAMVVELENMPPCLITKKDGATLYATRDLAAALYRYEQYKPAKIFYVVGNEQTLHFKQLFSVLDKMGYAWAENYEHVPFGMMLKDGKKMSTRKGKVVLLANVLEEAILSARQNIEQKNPTLAQKELVAKQVGVGAVLFNDLKNDRMNDIEFSLEQMLTFEGETGPYMQYTFARIQSLLRKGNVDVITAKLTFLDSEAWHMVKLIEAFPKWIEKAYDQADPSLIAKFSLQLARAFNKFYAYTKILDGSNEKESRLVIAYVVGIVIEECLTLLGMEAPKGM
ncbi:MAG: arginine--tRNA ligase [Lysinibacillus sp.]